MWHPIQWERLLVATDEHRAAITVCPRVGWVERLLYYFKNLGD